METRAGWIKLTAAWTMAAAALVGLGCLLYSFVPPEPRWRLENCHADLQLLKHGQIITADATGEMPGLALRDAASGEIIRTLFADLAVSPNEGIRLSFDASYQLAAVTDRLNNTFRVASLQSGEERPPVCFDDPLLHATLSQRGNVAAVELGSQNERDKRYVALVDLRSGNQWLQLPEHGLPEFLGDDEFVVLQGPYNSSLKFWDLRKRQWILELPRCKLQYPVEGPDFDDPFSSDLTIVVRQMDGPIQTWDLTSRTKIFEHVMPKPSEGLFSRSRSRNAERIAFSYYGNSSQAEVWDVRRQRFLWRTTNEGFMQASISPDGTKLAVLSRTGASEDHELTVVDLESGRSVWIQKALTPCFFLQSLPQFTRDGQSILCYGADDSRVTAAFYNALDGSIQNVIPIYRGPCFADVWKVGSERASVIRVQPERHAAPKWADWLLRLVPLLAQESSWQQFIMDVDHRRLIPLSPSRFEPEADELYVAHGALFQWKGDARTVTCWDLPMHGAWRWALGVPASVGALLLSATWIWRRWSNYRAAMVDQGRRSEGPGNVNSLADDHRRDGGG